MAFHVWQFNVTIEDDMQIVNALKRSLEGRLPQQECPVSVDIAIVIGGTGSISQTILKFRG